MTASIALQAIDDLRTAADELLASVDPGARRVGARLIDYLVGAKVGADLSSCLGLAPINGVPWWLVEGREVRDATLRDLANRFYADRRTAQAAYAIERESLRYAASAWRFDQMREDMPADYAGDIRGLLWRAFKSGGPMPLKRRRLQTILTEKMQSPCVAIASVAPDDDGETSGEHQYGSTHPATESS